MSPLLTYAFRPFFGAMAGYAILAMLLWVLVLQGAGPSTLPVNVTYWHAHEMLVGFAFAGLAGFVLTAVANWTGRPPISGALLLTLLLAWLGGRMAMLLAGLLPWGWVAVLDSLFPLLLAAMLGREVGLAGNARNIPVAALVLLLACANGLYHVGTMGWLPLAVDAERIGLMLMLHGMLLMLTLISGRIVPAFSANWLRARGASALPQTSVRLDRMTITVTGFCGLYASVAPFSALTGGLALLAAVLHSLRLWRWRGLAVAREPLLLVLHVAYAWIPLGYLLLAAVALGWGVAPNAAIHAFAVGAIGMMLLAMGTRVVLGHTGRALRAGPVTVAAYVLLMLAAVLRVYSPWGAAYYPLINAAAAAWVLGFASYLLVYLPMMMRRSID